MTTTAATTRHLATLWQGTKPWHWTALKYGHAQTVGYRNHVRYRRYQFWQLHITPIHIGRHGDKWEYGICLGKRTLYVLRHR